MLQEVYQLSNSPPIPPQLPTNPSFIGFLVHQSNSTPAALGLGMKLIHPPEKKAFSARKELSVSITDIHSSQDKKVGFFFYLKQNTVNYSWFATFLRLVIYVHNPWTRRIPAAPPVNFTTTRLGKFWGTGDHGAGAWVRSRHRRMFKTWERPPLKKKCWFFFVLEAEHRSPDSPYPPRTLFLVCNLLTVGNI